MENGPNGPLSVPGDSLAIVTRSDIVVPATLVGKDRHGARGNTMGLKGEFSLALYWADTGVVVGITGIGASLGPTKLDIAGRRCGDENREDDALELHFRQGLNRSLKNEVLTFVMAMPSGNCVQRGIIAGFYIWKYGEFGTLIASFLP